MSLARVAPRPRLVPLPLVAFALSTLLAACGAGAATGDGQSDGDDFADLDLEESGTNDPAETSALALDARRAKEPVVVTRLREATAGLFFLSESDYPFEILLWKKPGGLPSAPRIAALTQEDPTAPVEERSLAAFFRGATTAQPENGPEALETVERYRALVALIRRDLRHVRVYRFGRIEIHAYVVGVTRSGDWVALSTTQIET